MTINEIASAIYNDVVSGLRGITSTPTMSIEQLEDEVIEERLVVIKELYLRNLISLKDMMLAINCIEVDCKDLARCCNFSAGEKALHFEIPQIVNDLGTKALEFVGSIDRQKQYVIYTDTSYQFHKYKKRGADEPYVYIETTPNENGMYDCYIFNAPLIKTLSIIAVFKDPRQSEQFTCCNAEEVSNMNFLTNDIKRRITEKKVRWYRSLAAPNLPNDQVAKA